MTDLNISVGTRPTDLDLNLGVGTVMGVGVEYTAGEGIWIKDHVIGADVTQAELDGKAAVGHKHAIADVDGLQAALDSKADTNGYYATLTAGATDALMGDPSESTWATRTSTGSGMARVESVKGATVVQDGELVPVQIAGIRSTGFNLLNIHRDVVITNANVAEYRDGSKKKFAENQMWVGLTMNDYFSSACVSSYNVGDDTVSVTITRSGYGLSFPVKVMPNTQYHVSSGNGSANAMFAIGLFDASGVHIAYRPASGVAASEFTFTTTENTYWATVCMRPNPNVAGVFVRPILNISNPALNGQYKPYTTDSVEWPAQTLRAAGTIRDELTAGELVTRVGERAYQSGDESDATVRTDGTTTYYPLATPATTPISPALPMTYKVEQGGSESIVVPDGEVSAAPVLTVAEGETASNVVMDALAAIATPDGPTAMANHAVNTYLTMQGKLYKVTRAIAVGEQITSGINVTETTVMDELIARTA